ncbi:MAG: DUF6491 family protein [Gammaproteobacteria bacterium]
MAKRMNRMAAAAVAATCLVPLSLSGCATKSSSSRNAREQADLNAPIATASAQVARYRVRDWSALNDHTLIVVATDGKRYRAETLGPCTGLDFSTRVGFVNRGGFNQIDRTSSVVLADGTRCPFQSFDEIRSPESKALDAYEKAGDTKPDSTAKQDEPKPK